MVGDLVGSEEARERAVTGGTPNLAARLQELAPPGGIVIAEATRRLLGGMFEVEDLGPQVVKGLAAAVRPFRVGAERGGVGRFEARQPDGSPAPMVGRDPELALLLERWRRARHGEGQAVLLTGEPGIGKSRLVRALAEALSGERHVAVCCHCSPYHDASALWPVIQHLEQAVRFEASDAGGERLAKLETLLDLDPDEAGGTLPLLASLLGIEAGSRYRPLDLTPQQRRAATLEVLVGQLLALAPAQPVLLVMEDLHWSDPTTLELVSLLLGRIAAQPAAQPLLVLLTARPEFRAEKLGEHAHLTRLDLGRLGPEHTAAIIAGVVHGKPVPEEVAAEIVRRTDGVPLFVEELTKAVVESGLLEECRDRYELGTPLPALTVPATLHDSLMARLDRLAPVKELAQLAACLGRDFDHALLAAVSPLGPAALDAALNRLVAAELLFRRGRPGPEAAYAFKHALVRDAAYDSLLKSRRRQYHAHIAATLEESFPERAAAEPEVLAVPCLEAGLAGKAAAYRLKAGQRALARPAVVEAVAQLTKGVEALQHLPPSIERSQLELALQSALGSALISSGGWGVAETGRAFARTRALCRELGVTERLFPVLWGLAVYHVNRAELPAAEAAAAELMRLAEEQKGDPESILPAAHRVAGVVRYHLGELEEARHHFERVLALYENAPRRPLDTAYVVDFRVVALGFLANLLFFLGFPDQAQAASVASIAHARRLTHPPSLRLASSWAAQLAIVQRDAATALAHAEAAVALCIEQDFAGELTDALGHLACARAMLGSEASCDGLKQAITAYRARGQERTTPLWLAVLAEAHAGEGRPEEGLALLDEALGRIGRTREGWITAELHRLRGELLLALPRSDPGEAEACFHRTLALAGVQRARMWELRAARSLAKLWLCQGRSHEARELLAGVHGWFTEGFGTQDLREAKMLLEELARVREACA